MVVQPWYESETSGSSASGIFTEHGERISSKQIQQAEISREKQGA